MRRGGGGRKILDLAGFADVDTMHRDLLLVSAGNFRGERLQPRFVAIGQRQIAAARGKLERQRPADTAGGAGDGGGCTSDRSHFDGNSNSGKGRASRFAESGALGKPFAPLPRSLPPC